MEWDVLFPDVNVEYIAGLPNAVFFNSIPENSLVVLDDLWSEACKSLDIIKAFKVFTRKRKISMIIISQCYFGGSDGGREIRNNVDVFVLFENHGDAEVNKRIMRKLGYLGPYRELMKTPRRPHCYIVVNCSAKLPHNILRVSTNLFSEEHDFVECFK